MAKDRYDFTEFFDLAEQGLREQATWTPESPPEPGSTPGCLQTGIGTRLREE